MGSLLHSLTLRSLGGAEIDLVRYTGRVVLIVNTASKCGYTPQLKSLEALSVKYRDSGLSVLGFPSADFGGQEFDEAEQIADFCQTNYGVTFDLFAKSHVVGAEASPLFRKLTDDEAPFGGPIAWNFEKFLLARDGSVVGRFRSGIGPLASELVAAIEAELTRPI